VPDLPYGGGAMTDTVIARAWNAEAPTPSHEKFSSGVLVLGIGNPLLSDDGLGIHALEVLRSDSRLPSATRLLDGGTFGPELLGQLGGCRRLLLLDAVDAGRAPGTIVRVDLDGNCTAARKTSVHEFGINELLDDLRLLGEAPDEVLLLGIQPASVALGTSLTPDVLTAVPALLEAAVNQLIRWEGERADECSGKELRKKNSGFETLGGVI